MLDLLIRDAHIVDGTGAPARRGDVGVRDGRIVAVGSVGQVDEPSGRTVDADGLTLAPGFVDLHTHYDAQLFWDPTASPSVQHGVTTVFGGNCGFTLAPAAADQHDYLTRMLARVEGMPLDALRAGLDWGWSSFGDWLKRLEGRIAVNAGRLNEGAHSEEAGILRGLARWERLIIVETFAPENADATGRTVGEVAAARGGEPFDTLLDIVIADELRTGLTPPRTGDDLADWRLRAQVWRHPGAVIGGSDAGAHLDMMCGAIYTTSLLGHGVREHQVVSLEEAVRLLTDVPARLYGLAERGRIAPGWHADLVLFDPTAIDHGPERTRYDLPAGAPRLVADARGITSVLVDGVEVCRDGVATGALPGTVLRSGRDTETVPAGAARRRCGAVRGGAGQSQ